MIDCERDSALSAEMLRFRMLPCLPGMENEVMGDQMKDLLSYEDGELERWS